MKTKHCTILILLVLSSFTNFLFAQNIAEQMTRKHPDCKTIFMNAMDLFPKLYKEKSFDSLRKALDIWEISCGDVKETRITRMLLNLEQERFTLSTDVDGVTLKLLSEYARSFPATCSMQTTSPYIEPGNTFYRFSVAWARLLLENKKLDENEIFICKVLSGEIKNPQHEIEKNPDAYPEFTVMLKKNFESNRKVFRGNIAFSTGAWIPTKNLSILGVHPAIGFHIGGRSMHHEVDLTLQVRIIESANTYAVKRDGQMDSTDYYVGGYIGLDYMYYLVSRPKYDFGLLAGMGWDGFDFAPQPYSYYYDYPYYSSHVTIGSFNANAGLRFNYYFKHSFYIGLQGRYNGINYSSHGGTNLSGDAFSIDLIFGLNGPK